jgi:hypothetical protein
MSRVITVSRFFPQYHPRKGEPTYFVQKIWKSIIEPNQPYSFHPSYLSPYEKEYEKNFPINAFNPLENIHNHSPKHHTIRAGKRWKTGDKASIRVWGDDVNPKSGRKGAYHSKQITIAPDEEVTVFDFEITDGLIYIEKELYAYSSSIELLDKLAENDGLTQSDLLHWFNYPKNFSGQIITWKKDLKY